MMSPFSSTVRRKYFAYIQFWGDDLKLASFSRCSRSCYAYIRPLQIVFGMVAILIQESFMFHEWGPKRSSLQPDILAISGHMLPLTWLFRHLWCLSYKIGCCDAKINFYPIFDRGHQQTKSAKICWDRPGIFPPTAIISFYKLLWELLLGKWHKKAFSRFWFWTVWNDGWIGGKIKQRISIPCVVHHGVIFCPSYAKNHLVVFRIYKLKQGAGRRIYLHSATISLWNMCTYCMPFFLYDAQKCSFICFTPLTGLPTETVPTKKNSYHPHQNDFWALISKLLSNSFHDNPLVTWQRGRGTVGTQNV